MGLPATRAGPGVIDLPLALLAGAAVAALAAFMAPTHLAGRVLDDDFEQYCTTVAILAGTPTPDGVDYVLRTPFPALPAAWLTPSLGVVRALLTGNALALAALGAFTWLWACVLGGRAAAVVAVALICASTPLVTGVRQLTTYPVLTAQYAACALGVVVAARWRNNGALLAGAVGAGLALLGDQFAPFWVGPGLLVLLAVALSRAPALPRLALVALPLALSWIVARALPPEVLFYADSRPPRLSTLEARLQAQEETRASLWGIQPTGEHTATVGQAQVDALRQVGAVVDDPGLLWGWSGPADLATSVRVLTQAVGEREGEPERPGPVVDLVPREVFPGLVVLGLGLGVVGLRRRHEGWVVLAAVATTLPYLGWLLVQQHGGAQPLAITEAFASLPEGTNVTTVRPKLLMLGLAATPTMFGLIWAALSGDGPRAPAGRPGPSDGAPRPALAAARLLLTGLLALALTLGLFPSLAGPDSPLRVVHEGETGSVQRAIAEIEAPGALDVIPRHPMGPCRARLSQEVHGGLR